MAVKILGEKKFKFCPMLSSIVGVDEMGQAQLMKVNCAGIDCLMYCDKMKSCNLSPENDLINYIGSAEE